MNFMDFFKPKDKNTPLSARDRDKMRESEQSKIKPKKEKAQRKIKRTVIDTMPYDCFVSNHVILLRSGVRVGRETLNLYSKTYLVPDINYSTLTRDQQKEIIQVYIDLLNGFDSTTSLQVTLLNSQINKEQFSEKLLLKDMGDGLDLERQEFNQILRDKIMNGQNGLQCRKYFTITTAAANLDAANTIFFNLEAHLISCLAQIGTEPIPLNANDRVRLMADILYDVDQKIDPISRLEFARKAEKQLCCPNYFEFKRDYFMYNDKYARCLYFRKLPQSIQDTLFKELIGTNQSLIISENIEFVEPSEAIRMVRRKQTDMKQEAIAKTNSVSARRAFVDPIEGTQLAMDMEQAAEFLEDLQTRNQKMTLCQCIIMITADSFEELQKNTEAIQIILRKYQIESLNAPYRQEIAFDSVFPVGNSFSCDSENNLQVRRTLSSESTAVFMPFDTRELLHKGGLYYGQNRLSHSVIMFDRKQLDNPNGFIFGVPGSGKSFLAKL